MIFSFSDDCLCDDVIKEDPFKVFVNPEGCDYPVVIQMEHEDGTFYFGCDESDLARFCKRMVREWNLSPWKDATKDATK